MSSESGKEAPPLQLVILWRFHTNTNTNLSLSLSNGDLHEIGKETTTRRRRRIPNKIIISKTIIPYNYHKPCLHRCCPSHLFPFPTQTPPSGTTTNTNIQNPYLFLNTWEIIWNGFLVWFIIDTRKKVWLDEGSTSCVCSWRWLYQRLSQHGTNSHPMFLLVLVLVMLCLFCWFILCNVNIALQMDAYRIALHSKVDCIEIDVSRSFDGVLFALHDRYFSDHLHYLLFHFPFYLYSLTPIRLRQLRFS